MSAVEQSGTFTLGDLRLRRLGYGAMYLSGPGVFGPPKDRRAAVFADLNKYASTMHFLGQSTILTLSNDRATGEVYCMPHHLTIDGAKRSLMIAALRYADTYVKQDGLWLYAERRLYVDWIEERPLL
jgi:hypothetical protein